MNKKVEGAVVKVEANSSYKIKRETSPTVKSESVIK